MAKTNQFELHRLFLIDSLPEPLTRARSHLQIFDNYILGTRLRIRRMRNPYTNSWTRVLQQRFTTSDASKVAEIYLNEAELLVLERLDGVEVRKNRYFQEVDAISMAFDVYLGRQTGLMIAKASFNDRESCLNFDVPPFALVEVTGHAAFDGSSFAGRDLEQLRKELVV